jgi:hypothetical protein
LQDLSPSFFTFTRIAHKETALPNFDEPKQVFLGGACGLTTWRKDIAIPILEAAGVTYHNPQMPLGAWKEDDQFDEMRRKDECLVQLFVINGATRGVASVAEVAYLIGAGKPVAIVLEDIAAGTDVYGKEIDAVEADDLNRGRIFVRAMAERHKVPIFTDIADGTRYCAELVKSLEGSLTIGKVNEVLSEVNFGNHLFNVEETAGGFHIWISGMETDSYTGEPSLQEGRKWFVSRDCTPSDVVRTAFKSVVTWAEHEARESFKYKDVRVFNPHLDIEAMVARAKKKGLPEDLNRAKPINVTSDEVFEKQAGSKSQPCAL